MGEQFIDLFTAGAYALVARVYAALAGPSLAWLFYLLAAAGMLFALLESAVEQRPGLWLRHLAAVCLSSVLTLLPQRVDLTQLTYGAPGRVEQLFGTRVGAAPHLTFWIERLGATAASSLRALTHQTPVLAVPGVESQVNDIASDPATIDDAQLRANLEIWRRRIVPQLLQDHPDIARQLRDAGLSAALLRPAPVAPEFLGNTVADQARAVQAILSRGKLNLRTLLQAQAPLLNQITQDAGAVPWIIADTSGASTMIRFAQRGPIATPRRTIIPAPAYDDALKQADAVAGALRAQLPQGDRPITVESTERLYELLGRSILYSAGVSIAADPAARAAIGSLCQRAGSAVCRAAMAPVIEASTRLRVADSDRYNTAGWTTWLQQPVTTTLLTITALVLGALSTLVVSVLPFALGVAKAIAIVISMVGTWVLLWPGRARIALSWMIGPISFVSLWSVLFNIWNDIEPSLAQIAIIAGNAAHGSWSAQRAMSIAISLGYMGLPSLALGIIYGESGRALYHASARLENALLMAWHTRAAAISFGRRWLVNSPLARRWNQRTYRAVGLGALRPARSAGGPHRAGALAGAGRGSRVPPGAAGSGGAPPPAPGAAPPGAAASGSRATSGKASPQKRPATGKASRKGATSSENPGVKAIDEPRDKKY